MCKQEERQDQVESCQGKRAPMCNATKIPVSTREPRPVLGPFEFWPNVPNTFRMHVEDLHQCEEEDTCVPNTFRMHVEDLHQ